MPNEVKVKKISAYPIPVSLATKMGPAQGEILKLTLIGFLAEIKSPFLEAGEKLEVSFELPISHKIVKEQCVVLKQYNHWKPQEGTPSADTSANTPLAPPTPGHKPGIVQHIVEIHFRPLTQEGRSAINEFLKKLQASAPPSV